MIRIRLLVAVGLVAVLCALAGLVLLRQSEEIRSTESAQNLAVVNGPLTTEVQGEIGRALTQIFSIDPSNPEATRDAADLVLTGDAADQYATLIGDLEKMAKGQKLTLTATVAVIGVRHLTATTADLLVFLDQSSVRKSQRCKREPSASGCSNIGPAQLTIGAVKRDGVWLIDEIDLI